MKHDGSASIMMLSLPGSAALPAWTIHPTPSAPQSCSPALLPLPHAPALPTATELPDPAHQSVPHHVTCEESLDEDDSTFTSCTPVSHPTTLTPAPVSAPTPASVPPVLIPPDRHSSVPHANEAAQYAGVQTMSLGYGHSCPFSSSYQ